MKRELVQVTQQPDNWPTNKMSAICGFWFLWELLTRLWPEYHALPVFLIYFATAFVIVYLLILDRDNSPWS